MTRSTLLALMILSLAGVVAVSAAAGRRERDSLMQRFRAEQAKLADDEAAAVKRRVASVGRDLQLINDLLARVDSRQRVAGAGKDGQVQAVFDALVTAVAHYRTVGIFGARERAPLVGIDPQEDQVRAVPALVVASGALALRLLDAPQKNAVDYLQVGERRFYLFAARTGFEAAVISVDADLMFTDALLPTPAYERILVVEPTASFWIACNIGSACRARGFAELPLELRLAQPPAAPVPPAAVLSLEARHVLWTTRIVATEVGDFHVAVVASTDDVEQLQSVALRRALLTAGCAVAVVLIFGGLITREQRRAASLAARLHDTQVLAQMRERSDKILENAPIGIVGISRDGLVVFANRYLRRRLADAGGGRDPASNDNAADASAAPPVLVAWLRDIREAVNRAFATGQTITFQGNEFSTEAGSMRDIEAHVVPLENPIESVDALVLVQDLSDVRALQRQLIRAEKLITVGALSAGIAHEVGTPLMVIRGRAEHLLEADPHSRASRDLAAIVDQIDTISTTIRQVLDFAHPQKVQAMPTDAAASASRAVELLAWRLDKRRLRCTITATPSTPPVRADPQQLTQVFLNLIANAADASPEGAAIQIALRPDDGAAARFVCIEIADKGSGIAPENLSAVFDPYFTTKAVGEGAGLGLTVVAAIVSSHGGDVTLRGAVGGGTVATVLWPAAAG